MWAEAVNELKWVTKTTCAEACERIQTPVAHDAQSCQPADTAGREILSNAARRDNAAAASA